MSTTCMDEFPISVRRAGDADISTTLNIYAQANTKRKEEVMDKMEQLLLGVDKSLSE